MSFNKKDVRNTIGSMATLIGLKSEDKTTVSIPKGTPMVKAIEKVFNSYKYVKPDGTGLGTQEWYDELCGRVANSVNNLPAGTDIPWVMMIAVSSIIFNEKANTDSKFCNNFIKIIIEELQIEFSINELKRLVTAPTSVECIKFAKVLDSSIKILGFADESSYNFDLIGQRILSEDNYLEKIFNLISTRIPLNSRTGDTLVDVLDYVDRLPGGDK